MSRESPVTIAIIASVWAMAAFALWAGSLHGGGAEACFGPGCADVPGTSAGSSPAGPMGLIDL